MSPTALGSRYLLDEPIGRGGMGVVWRGRDRTSGAVYAIKVLRPEIADDPSAVARFVRERTALVKLRHPNVVTVHDMIVEGDRLALVMNLVAGGNLSQLRRSRGGRLEQDEAIGLIAQVAAGLAAAHAAGIVHRDLKPANMLVSWDGETPRVQLADFGIARVAEQAPVTTEGSMMGTAAYLAPEVIRGGEPGPESDVYALGITLYELLSDHPPFTGAVAAVLHAHVTTPPEPVPGVRGELRALISDCLAKDPRSRPSAAQMASTLNRLTSAHDAPSRARPLRLVRPLPGNPPPGNDSPAGNDPPPQGNPPPSDPPQGDPPPRRRSPWWPALAAGGTALAAAAVTAVVLLAWPARPASGGGAALASRSSAPSAGASRSPASASTPPPRPLSWRCGTSSRQHGGIMYTRACIAVQGSTLHIRGYLWKVPSDLSPGDYEQVHLVLWTAGGPVAQFISPECAPGRCEYSARIAVHAGSYRARADFFFDDQNEFQGGFTPYITVPLPPARSHATACTRRVRRHTRPQLTPGLPPRSGCRRGRGIFWLAAARTAPGRRCARPRSS